MAITDSTTKSSPTPARRRFLAALTGAVAMPAAVALPAVAATQGQQESPELLALGAKVPDLMARLHAGKARDG
jgi:hypothetical protein